MAFYADLHIHSRYSRACSRDLELGELAWWARRKGLSVVGTGDFTHPAWFEHLCEVLVQAEPGLYQLRPELASEVDRRLPASCRGPVRFMLSVEIATIYKRAERTRKVHHLLYVPDFAAARALTRELAKVGNLASDGRPILGLDSRDLLEITLTSDPGAYLIPAHIWTPWFSVLGSKSGFDTIADCYGDLTEHIFALETGLSSDPPMNYRLAGLDRYRLVSNSDAHSPPMLGREATAFDTDVDYFAIRDALRTGHGDVGTIEFFPEEGKYHLDGHRNCGLRLHPADTREHAGHRCPACGKPLTVGVLHRVEDLADRPQGFRPARADEFTNLVPLPEIVAELRGLRPASKTVRGEVSRLVAEFGSELHILRELPLDELAGDGSPLLGEAIRRLRSGEVIREGGYDGEYGAIRLFEPHEIRSRASAPGLFEVSEPHRRGARVGRDPAPARPAAQPSAHEPPQDSGAGTAGVPAPAGPAGPAGPPLDGSVLGGLDPDQRRAASSTDGPLLVVAGPGTGKTRTLVHRLAYLVTEQGVPPERCLAVTFTRRARGEMRERLAALIGAPAQRVTITTFHGLGASLVRECHEQLGLARDVAIADEAQRRTVAEELGLSARDARRLLDRAQPDPEMRARFEKALRERNLVDFDDLVSLPVDLLSARPEVAEAYRDRYRWICVDEYQDVDERQYQLLRLLCPPDGNLCAIGDPDQAIYGFRGADVGFFLRFRRDYPGARTAALTRNYRSGSAIVTGALQVIHPATLVPDRALHAARAEPAQAGIGLHPASDASAEAEYVVTTIEQLLGGSSFHALDSGRAEATGPVWAAQPDLGAEGPSPATAGRPGTAGLPGSGEPAELSFADIAVLYRTETASRAITEALTRAGLPFQKRSHDRLSARPGVAELVRELRHRGLDLREAAEAAIAALPASTAVEQAAHIRTAAELLTPLAERCGELHEFLAELSLGAEVDTWDPRADRISLLTVHAAKGLEFPVVFLVGCEDGLLPLRWPHDPEGPDLQEERRLFFVGMTRAQSRLFLSHARSRNRHGSGSAAEASPFLAALSEDLVSRAGEPVARRRRRDPQLRLL